MRGEDGTVNNAQPLGAMHAEVAAKDASSRGPIGQVQEAWWPKPWL